jgi:hypothetical protein
VPWDVPVLREVLLFAARESPRAVLGNLLLLELRAETGDLDLVLLDERVRVLDDLLARRRELDGFEPGRKVEGRVGLRDADEEQSGRSVAERAALPKELVPTPVPTDSSCR